MKILKLIVAFILWLLSLLGIPQEETIAAPLGSAPAFVENLGQWSNDVLYAYRGSGREVVVKNDGVLFDFYNKTNDARIGHVVKMKFSTIGDFEGRSPLGYKTNFLLGNDPDGRVSGANSYENVILSGVAEGIDAVLYFDESLPRYDLVVAPGADPEAFEYEFEGADAIEIVNGELLIKTSIGYLSHSDIFAYQEVNGEKRQIECEFSAKGDKFTFTVGEYDRNLPLIIDPLVFSTYFGSTEVDEIRDMAYDANGYCYVAGYTESWDLPTTTGAYTENYQESGDGFAMKFKMKGVERHIEYITYLGAAGKDEINSCDVDLDGALYCGGSTNSEDFPLINNFQYEYNKEFEGFVLKLNPDGDDLEYSSYIGGTKNDYVTAIVVSPEGEAAIVGYTESTNFPLAGNTYQNELRAGYDGFISRVSSTGTTLSYSTYFGGSGEDKFLDVNLDNIGYLYISGYTESGDWPIIPYRTWGWGSNKRVIEKPFDYDYNGGKDAVFIKIGEDGGTIKYSTYFGGIADDFGLAVQPDDDGTVWIAGATYKEPGTEPQFPVTESAYQITHAGGIDCFYAKLDVIQASAWFAKDQRLFFCTYLGGQVDDEPTDMIFNPSTGGLTITGYTTSKNFPQAGGDQVKHAGGKDVFITEMTNNGGDIIKSTLFGGSGNDVATAIHADERGDYTIAGYTTSKNLPMSADSFFDTFAGGASDGFCTKLAHGDLDITRPIEGSRFCVNNPAMIAWQAVDFADEDEFNLRLFRDSDPEPIIIADDIKGTSYEWNVPGDLEPGSDYKIKIFHNSGIQCETEYAFTVAVAPKIESVTSSVEELVVCEGDPIEFSVDTYGENVSYQWMHDDKDISGAVSETYSIESVDLDMAGAYKVEVSGFCPPADQSEELLLQVIPKTEILAQSSDLEEFEGRKVELWVEPKGQNLTYEWFRNDQRIIGATDSNYVFNSISMSDEGTYKCKISGDCGSIESDPMNVAVMVNSVEEIGAFEGLRLDVFYEDNSSDATVVFSSEKNCRIQLEVLDYFGNKVVDLFEGVSDGSEQTINLNSAEYASGVYWVVAVCGRDRLVEKLVFAK